MASEYEWSKAQKTKAHNAVIPSAGGDLLRFQLNKTWFSSIHLSRLALLRTPQIRPVLSIADCDSRPPSSAQQTGPCRLFRGWVRRCVARFEKVTAPFSAGFTGMGCASHRVVEKSLTPIKKNALPGTERRWRLALQRGRYAFVFFFVVDFSFVDLPAVDFFAAGFSFSG